MPGSEDFIQRAVHALEAGGLAVWIRRGLVVMVILLVALYYFIGQFRGLTTSQAMDQAQIGRAIASGKGWSTNFARPLAAGLLQANGKDSATQVWIDTYNAPLPPLVNSIALLAVKSHWKMPSSDILYAGDKAIAFVAIIFFLLSVVVLFFTARRLFDQKIAIFACALVLMSDMMWQYSLSGLPQMLLLFLFNGMLYFLVRAVEAQYAGLPVTRWLIAVGLSFGLLALTHALTLWIFVAALIFSTFFFTPRRWVAVAIIVGAFALVYTPWLIRTYAVSGSPGGVATYSLFDGIVRSEAAWMRQPGFSTENMALGAFRNKINNNIISQLNRIFQLLGWNVVAMAFFVSLLHPFKRPETSAIRWLVLAMWSGATLGIAVYGLNEEQGFAANQLHLLFIPIMVCYGLAFLLVQWNRLEIKFPFSRAAFIALLLLLCGYPMIYTILLAARRPAIVWPPYIPPYIAVLRSWMQPNEITASDMPWAIAWYADRRSVWLPDTIKNFSDLNDYKKLGGPIAGLYLTPISGSGNKWGDIVRGEYKDWSGIIQRTVSLEKFPLRFPTLALGTNDECVFISDTDRTKIKPE
jgi:4-amino-4-deoxy-L-arabinose transferase-like glycosyltransferase